jgi:hypothetical protein
VARVTIAQHPRPGQNYEPDSELQAVRGAWDSHLRGMADERRHRMSGARARTVRHPLTARGVKAMLTRARVDCCDLEITDGPVVWRDVETGERTTSVLITGPEETRRAAFRVLLERGLSVAPYPDRDYWSRRGGGR